MAFKLLVRTSCLQKCSRGRKCLTSNDWNIGGVRELNSGQVFTALKPFFFAVHPDLFGQFPKERAVNENSLKQLNAYIESSTSDTSSYPSHLTFYLRKQSNSQNQDKFRNAQLANVTPSVTSSESVGGRFKAIRIDLGQKDVRRTVHLILQKCNLSTTYIDSLPQPQKTTSDRNTFANAFDKSTNARANFWNNFEDFNVGDVERDLSSYRSNPRNLQTWLDKNVEDAKAKLKDCWPTREEIIRLRENLCNSLGLTDIIWDCGWGTRHFRGCLESFQALAAQHPETMEVLRGRQIIFGRETGVSLDGQVILNSGEVRTNWLDLISNVKKFDTLILRIPSVQMTLSRTLQDINVVHRKFGPKRLAETYESLLRKLITSIGDYQGRNSFPKQWPEMLDHLELVVESDAGPLMVSPTGQIIVPANCPPFLLVNFITTNMEEASTKLEQYKRQKYEEKDLHKQCLEELGLVELQKDDNVTPNLMIECCQRLLSSDLAHTLKGTHLWITTYYSVLSDGEICIPWNWKSLQDDTI